MNERIRLLARQAGATTTQRSGWIDYGTLDLDGEKFAELIVRECMDLLEDFTNDIYFGGIEYAVVGASETLQEHFGIEE